MIVVDEDRMTLHEAGGCRCFYLKAVTMATTTTPAVASMMTAQTVSKFHREGIADQHGGWPIPPHTTAAGAPGVTTTVEGRRGVVSVTATHAPRANGSRIARDLMVRT